MIFWTRIRPGIVLLAGFLLFSCSPGEYRIGFLAGLSGPTSQTGIEGRRALDLAVTQVNAGGGIGGHPVRLIAVDDQGSPEKALENLKTLESQGVRLVIGPMTSGEMDLIWPYMNEHRILFLSPTAVSMRFSGKDDYFYRLGIPTNQIGAFLAQAAARQGLKKIAVVLESSNGNYTREILTSFQSQGKKLGIQVVQIREFDMRQDKDPGPLVSSLTAGSPDGFLFLMNGYDAALFTQKLAQAGLLQPVFLAPWSMTRDLIDLGGRQVSRLYLAGFIDPASTQPKYREFQNLYRELYAEDPDFPAVFAWEAFFAGMKVLAQVSEKADGTEMKKILGGLKDLEGLQSPLSFDQNGDAVRDLYLLQVNNGQFVKAAP